MNTRDIGRIGEDLTVDALQKNGYNILARNYTIRGGEIDIIAEKGDIIAFVEVKTRADNSLDEGVLAVNKKKQRLIVKTSQEYLYRVGSTHQPRFDIADVVIKNNKPISFKYYQNAFDAEGLNTIL